MAHSLQAAKVNVNFFNGSHKVYTAQVEEGGTYTLSALLSEAVPAVNMSDSVCRDYEFVGWKVGSPVEGTETPVTPTSVEINNNMNLYAVYHHTDPSKVNNFVRITQTDNLEANGEYLIICYYVYGGEQQYYAMTCNTGTYNYYGTKKNRLNAARLYPRNGVITAPDEGLIWTLKNGASANTWRWYNAVGGKWLFLGASDQTMLKDTEGQASSCSITQYNGIFTIQNTSVNDSILKYVDDFITEEEDYFITGSYTDYTIYLYKRESAYTSFPDCNPWSVNLDALDGTIVGTSPASTDSTLTEASAGAKVTLPEAELTDIACSGWSFYGWSLDAPIKSTSVTPTDLISADTYDPLYNGVTLYAVYHASGEVTYYERITSSSDLTEQTASVDDEYIIITSEGDKAIGTDRISGAQFPLLSITDGGGNISLEEVTRVGNIVWKYKVDGSGYGHFVDNSGNKLAYGGKENYWFRVQGIADSKFVLWYYYSSYYYILKNNGTSTDEYEQSSSTIPSGNQYRFYIYKKVTKSATTYTPYPHCGPYTIYLHACGGNINGEQNVTLTQASAISSITMPSATPACPGEGWEFVGWFPDEDKESFEHMEFTDFVAGGEEYVPDHDEMHLYAVYRRITDRFRIIDGVDDIADGDTYIVTFYKKKDSEKYYDYVLSSQTSGGNLKGLEYQSPRDGAGFYLDISDSTGMWTINKVSDHFTFRNLDNNHYLRITNSGTSTTAGANNIYITDYASADWAVYIANGSNYRIHCDDGTYTSGTSSSYFTYIYRRIKEYSSWPHCEPFTVNFVPCGGTTEDDGTTKTEPAVYAGIELPDAYANADCSKEQWTFAGWATEPINEETDLQTFELYPAGTIYHPLSTHTTLYAVYHQKTQHYKRITTVGRLHTGTNYIITTSDNKAIGNMPNGAGNAISYKTVTPNAAHIIDNDDPEIEWRLEGVRGDYEWHNLARYQDEGGAYLDLSEPGQATLTKTAAHDNFDIIYNGANYLIRSCMSIAHYDGEKFLGLNAAGTLFTAIDSSKTASRLHIYRQQSKYHSYPVCTEDIDVIKWAKIDEEFNYVIVESYHLKGAPDIHDSYGSPERQTDGTYLVKFRGANLPPCSKALVEWDGVTSRIRIPHIVSSDATISSFMDAAEDCSDCNVYVKQGATLTINQTDSVHRLKLEDGARLNVQNGQTISVNTLVLFSEGDQAQTPEINLNTSGSIVLRNGELYHDRRIDEERYYWLSLPFDAQLKQISFSNEAANGGLPVYRGSTSEDGRFFVKYYNGAARAADADGGAVKSTYWTHVAPKGTDYTLQAGQGYNIGIGNQKTKYFNGQDYTHTMRVLRFTMRPGNTWLNQERNSAGTKTTNVVASTCLLEANAVHAGWNLIGNPYLHTYNTGTVPNDGNIRNGAWKKEKNDIGEWTGWYILDEGRTTTVPYLTIYDPSKRKTGDSYSQVLAASHDLKPFEAVFVQINEGTTINFFAEGMSAPKPAYMRMLEPQSPIRTGIILRGDESADKTGFVLSEEYTKEYEVGADLVKYPTGGVMLYSIDSLQRQLAFNGLSEEDAIAPIPVGVSFPAAGEYTFAFDDEWYRANNLDTLMLIDYMTGAQTNLLYGNYTVVVDEPTAVDNRFAVLIRLAKAPHITTDIDQTSETNQPRKIIRDGQLFILRENDIFNAVGTKVR